VVVVVVSVARGGVRGDAATILAAGPTRVGIKTK